MGAHGFGSRTSARREALQTQLWPLPALAVVLAVVMGVGLPRLDVQIADALPSTLKAYLFGGGAGAARTVLNAIASSLVTVTSLTFSLTVVTLQLASGQFSPRLLRTFTRDRVIHLTLALFLATFTYALTVLRTVRTDNNDQQQFVPAGVGNRGVRPRAGSPGRSRECTSSRNRESLSPPWLDIAMTTWSISSSSGPAWAGRCWLSGWPGTGGGW
jgi:hypothetical protein